MAVGNIKPLRGQLSLPFELGEDLTGGDPFFVYDDSGTPKIAKCFTKAGNKASFCRGYYNAMCLIDTDIVVVAYRDLAGSNRGKVIAGEIQRPSKTINWGTPFTFYSATLYYPDVTSHATGQFCVTFKGTGGLAEIRAGTVDASLNITMGSVVSLSVGTTSYNQVVSPAAGKIACVYRDSGTSGYLVARAATITGNVIGTPGAARTLISGSCSYMAMCSPDTDKISICAYYNARGYAVAATLTGTTVNAPGAISQFNSSAIYSVYSKSPATNKIVVMYRSAGAGYKPYARCTTLTGVTFDTWGDDIKVNDSSSYYLAIGIMDTDKLVFMMSVDTTPYSGIIKRATISGKAISLGTPESFYDGKIYYVDCIGTGTDEYMIIWYEQMGMAMTECLVVDGKLNSLSACLGLLSESGSTGEIKRGDLINGITKALLGMTPGVMRYIQDDGSISENVSPYPIAMPYKADEAFISKTLLGGW